MAKEFSQTELDGPKGWKVWKVIGRIDTQTADTAYEKGEAVVNANEKTVLDMSEMEYLSSAGLRVLLRLSKMAVKSGKSFTVAGPAGMVRTVLEDSGMDVLLKLKGSLEELD